MYADLEQKVCCVCKKVKDKKEFHADRTNKDGKYYSCKPCTKAKRKGYKIKPRKERKEMEFRRGLRRNYGLTVNEYNERFEAQNGCCEICKTHQTLLTRKLAVDHCHDSKMIRGLLCDNCNPMLGYAKENIERLESAIKYLNKFKK